jgi:hypothetical protein
MSDKKPQKSKFVLGLGSDLPEQFRENAGDIGNKASIPRLGGGKKKTDKATAQLKPKGPVWRPPSI